MCKVSNLFGHFSVIFLCVFLISVKRGLTKDITCLKDFMNDPKREEPLVGMFFSSKWYVFEFVTK